MATILNPSDLLLQGTIPRLVTTTLANNLLFGGNVTGTVNNIPVADITNAISNFDLSNDQNSAVITNTGVPTIAHTANKDGSVNITVTWTWTATTLEPQSSIDGFVLVSASRDASGTYVLGTTPSIETAYIVPNDRRSFVIFGVAADRYYTVGIRAYRRVDNNISTSGVIASALSVVAAAYRPTSTVDFSGQVTGNVTGQVNSVAVATITNAVTTVNDVVLPKIYTVGDIFTETWEGSDATTRVANTGLGELSVVLTGGATGGRYLRVGDNDIADANDQGWLVHKQLIPFDPSKTYKSTCRIRRGLDNPGSVYLGFVGVAADGVTLVNISGANTLNTQHYHAAAAATPIFSTNSWSTYVGYTSGYGTTVGTTNPGTLATPGKMHPDVRYLRPVMVVNYQNLRGITEIDSFIVENYTISSEVTTQIDNLTFQNIDGTIAASQFAASIEPITTVSSVPTVKSTQTIFNTTDGKLYRWTGTAYTATVPAADISGTLAATSIGNATISASKFATDIEPITTVSSVPTVKSTQTIFNTADGKLYRWTGSAYTATVPALDISGTIPNSKIDTVASTKITGQLTNTQIEAIAATKITGEITGTQIKDGEISTAKIAANAVTATQINSAAIVTDKLAAGAVRAQHLLVSAKSLNPDPSFESGVTGWAGFVRRLPNTDPAVPTSCPVEFAAEFNQRDNWFNASVDVVSGEVYRLSMWVNRGTGGGGQGLGGFGRVKNAQGTVLASFIWPNTTTTAAGWIRVTGIYTIPPNGARLEFGPWADRLTYTGSAWYADLSLEKVNDASLIVDGSISATQIATDAITANKILAGAVTADKILTGAITAAKIDAGAVTASKLVVADLSNIMPDADMRDDAAWTLTGGSLVWETAPSTAWRGLRTARLDAISGTSATVASKTFPVEAGAKLYFSAQGQVIGVTGGTFGVQIRFSSSDGMTSPVYDTMTSSSTTVTILEKIVTVPANIKYARVELYKASDLAISVRVGGVVVRRAASSELIVDGAITADKILAGQITSDKIAANAITAGKLSVLALELVNPVSSTATLNGWGGVPETGTGTVTGLSYNATEKAIQLTTAASLHVRPNTWQVNHDKIYRVNVRLKKGSGIGGSYFGVAGFTNFTTGTCITNNNGAGTEVLIPFNAQRVAGTQSTDIYFANVGAPTTYVNNVVYIVGANRDVKDCPEHTISGTQTNPFIKLVSSTSWAALRFLNWDNGASSDLFIKDISVTDIDSGQIVADNISANAITTDKIAANAITAGKILAGEITSNKIAANAITASKLLITDLTNLIKNPSFAQGNSDGWAGNASVLAKTALGVPANAPAEYVLAQPVLATDNNTIQSGYIDVRLSEAFYCEWWGSSSVGAGANSRLFFELSDQTGTGVLIVGIAAAGSNNTWNRYFGTYTIPVTFVANNITYTTARVRIGIGPVAGAGGTWYSTKIVVRRAASAELIVDGAVTADKVRANAITTGKLSVLATEYVNPVSVTHNLSGWGGLAEDGTAGSIAGLTYDGTEDAIKLDSAANTTTILSNTSWQVNHDKIYRVSVKLKKTVANGSYSVGVSGWTTTKAGQVSTNTSNFQGVNLTSFGTNRLPVGVANNTDQFFTKTASTAYVSFTCYIVGANRSIIECPLPIGLEDANTDKPFIKLDPTVSNASLRIFNINATSATSLFVKDITVVEIGTGIILADTISAGYIDADIGIRGAKLYGAELYSGGTVAVNKTGDKITSIGVVNPTFSVSGGNVIVNASNFTVTNGAGSAVAPFSVVDNVVKIDGAQIGNYIRSSNYNSTTKTGFNIDAVTGNAEFYNATVRGSLNADDITAGTITSNRLSIGSRGNVNNLLRNSDWTETSSRFPDNIPTSLLRWNWFYNFPAGTAAGTVPTNVEGYRRHNSGRNWNVGNGGMWMRDFKQTNITNQYVFSDLFPVEPTVSYEFSLYVSVHRCKVEMNIDWVNAAGGRISSTPAVSLDAGAAILGGSTGPNSMMRLWSSATAPALAVSARLIIVKYTTTPSAADNYSDLFAHRAMVCSLPTDGSITNQTTWVSDGLTTIDGGSITTGSIVADKIDTRGLTIKNQAGEVVFSSGDSVAGIKNMVGNSSFKHYTSVSIGNSAGGMPYDWKPYNNNDSPASYDVYAGDLFGSYFARVRPTAWTSNTLGWYVSDTSARVKHWFPGNWYTISFYARGGNEASLGTDTSIGLKMTGAYTNMGYSQVIPASQPTLTGNWQRYVFYVIPVQNATYTPKGELFISWEIGNGVSIKPGMFFDIACPQVELGQGVSSWSLSAFDSIGLSNPLTLSNASTFISSASIDSLQIRGNAVTVPGSSPGVSNSTSGPSVTLDLVAGQRVLIIGFFEDQSLGFAAPAAQFLQIFRGTAQVQSSNQYGRPVQSGFILADGTQAIVGAEFSSTTIAYVETPTVAGSLTYSLRSNVSRNSIIYAVQTKR